MLYAGKDGLPGADGSFRPTRVPDGRNAPVKFVSGRFEDDVAMHNVEMA
jgi:hypothetical protein